MSARPGPQPLRPSSWRTLGLGHHVAAWGLTNGFLVGVWALAGGGHPWPFYPAAGWAVLVGLHAVTASGVARRRSHRRDDPAPGATRRPGPTRPPSVVRVAVLFSDVARSTQLAAAMGDLAWSEILRRYRDLAAGFIEAHGGLEVSVAGDGIVARFPDERAAVRCAADIQRALEDQRRRTGFAVEVRMGVHAGEAVLEDADLVGHAVNVAARVSGEAAAGEILVTEAVLDGLGGLFPIEDRGLRQLKGIEGPRHLLAVRWR